MVIKKETIFRLLFFHEFDYPYLLSLAFNPLESLKLIVLAS